MYTSTPIQLESTPVRNNVVQRKGIRPSENSSNDDNCKVVLDIEQHPIQCSVDGVHVYLSTHGQLVASVLGDTSDVKHFDRLHFKLKADKCNTKCTSSGQLRREYKDIVSKLQFEVLREKTVVSEELKAYEQEYFMMNHEAPTIEDNLYCNLYKRFKNAKSLLRSWKLNHY